MRSLVDVEDMMCVVFSERFSLFQRIISFYEEA